MLRGFVSCIVSFDNHLMLTHVQHKLPAIQGADAFIYNHLFMEQTNRIGVFFIER